LAHQGTGCQGVMHYRRYPVFSQIAVSFLVCFYGEMAARQVTS